MAFQYIGGPYKPGATQTVSYTGTAGTISSAIGEGTNVVRVWTSTAAYIAFGASPTATSSDIPIPANTPEYFLISPGHKVSAIQQSSGGNLFVTEMSR